MRAIDELAVYREIAGLPTPPPPLTRDAALAALRAHKPVLERRFGVAELALFGSVARDEADENSDVDILVRFHPAVAAGAAYLNTAHYIEDLLGRRVDLVEREALRPELRRYVEPDLVHVR